MKPRRLPPLWLGMSTAASLSAAAYSVGLWIVQFLSEPIHIDVRMTYVAAQAGLRYGWPTIYDEPTLRSLSAVFPPDARLIDPVFTYLNPPLLAWLFVPLTLVPEPVAYAIWTAVSVAALVFAWWIAAPYAGVARFTLLPLALGLWPVLLALYYGQPTLIIVALLAASWWLTANERPFVAGIALAFATFLKPQDVLLIPVVLVVAGRYRVVAGWVAGCVGLGLAAVAALQASGLESWAHAITAGQESTRPYHTEYTLIHFFGLGPLTYALWALQALAAMAIAWWRRSSLEIVYAAGILGTVAVAFHFHELDYSILVFAAWLFLRSAPPLWQRIYLLAGIVTMQLLTFGPGATGAAADLGTHAPQLLFDASWLGIMALAAWGGRIAVMGRPTVVEARA